jgi:nickel-dependent lactate racemase
MRGTITDSQVAEIVARQCPAASYTDKRVLLIVPDGTRTAPIGVLFQTLFQQIGRVTKAFDALIALGTHQPMDEAAICRRLEIPSQQRRDTYGRVKFFNHAWNRPEALKQVGVLSGDEIDQLSEGRFRMEVPVEVSRMLFEYDQVIIVGPVFPHEVVGFSGGNKYLFPGVAGPQILNFFHWLGAVVTNPKIIGHKWTPVRKLINRAGAMVKVDKLCFCLVVNPDGSLAGLFAGTPEDAWDQASDLSAQVHIVQKNKPFRTILSCAPLMYDELWTAGKCMYKLEPVLADGGELIIFAPHLKEVCVSHGKEIQAIGYHCRDYFLKQWERFQNVPWGVLAHSSHVRGIGTFENGVEQCRASVTLASQIPQETCERLNLGYRDPNSLNPADFSGHEEEGVLMVPRGGEMLFRLKDPPAWAA